MQINDLEKDNTRKTKKYICGLGSRKIKQMLSLKTHLPEKRIFDIYSYS